mmetsp:Transcript_33999/g.59251  ORF Transcript_33999/g.59251 Transcript_33999/m.59251 type:complete len:322 (-) Transcript_33999:2304-3269(-)
MDIFRAVRSGDRAAIRSLITADPNAVHAKDESGNSPLHLAVELKKNEINVLTLLLDSGSDVNARNNQGATPLHHVALRKEGVKAVAELLLSRGADPNIQMRSGHTPLHLACEYTKVELVQALLRVGADIHLIDQGGNTPLLFCFTGKSRDSLVRDIVELLEAAGANLTAKNTERRDAFLLASACGYVKVCQFLVLKHVNPLVKDAEGNSAVHLAAKYGHAELTEILLTIEGMELMGRNSQGDSPLHLAAKNNHADVGVTLLRKGAKVNAKNIAGETPYDLVTGEQRNLLETKHPELVRAIAAVKGRLPNSDLEEDSVCGIF